MRDGGEIFKNQDFRKKLRPDLKWLADRILAFTQKSPCRVRVWVARLKIFFGIGWNVPGPLNSRVVPRASPTASPKRHPTQRSFNFVCASMGWPFGNQLADGDYSSWKEFTFDPVDSPEDPKPKYTSLNTLCTNAPVYSKDPLAFDSSNHHMVQGSRSV
jgi:hypothetical protein